MGRYYSGDISGKFWFAVQSSDDADYFGGVSTANENGIDYHFNASHVPAIEKGVEYCKNELRAFRPQLDEYFDKHNGYNDEELAEALKIRPEQVRGLLMWYARLDLGQKILACVQQTGKCDFEAEL